MCDSCFLDLISCVTLIEENRPQGNLLNTILGVQLPHERVLKKGKGHVDAAAKSLGKIWCCFSLSHLKTMASNICFHMFRYDEGLTLETLALKLFTVANLRYSTQPIIPNYLASHQHCTTVFFRNFPPFILLFSHSFSY